MTKKALRRWTRWRCSACWPANGSVLTPCQRFKISAAIVVPATLALSCAQHLETVAGNHCSAADVMTDRMGVGGYLGVRETERAS